MDVLHRIPTELHTKADTIAGHAREAAAPGGDAKLDAVACHDPERVLNAFDAERSREPVENGVRADQARPQSSA